ncbi:MAG TPA: hypothetical protein VE821_01235, partial [Pyrinomonadaceae bacterium]|nr:hypothetical protein [Pyrinomonadaceae bacterium]
FINREMSALRPAERRRTFFIQMTPDVRTGDPHAALVRSANFVLNPADIEDLPPTLDRAVRDFNELYRNYNQALQLQGI